MNLTRNNKLASFLCSLRLGRCQPLGFNARHIEKNGTHFHAALPPTNIAKSFGSWVPKASSQVQLRCMSIAFADFSPIQNGSNREAEVTRLVAKGVAAQKKVAWWLFGCSAWVFSMVVLGGLTRLTRSGLSMTEWKFTGSFPPMSDDEWKLEFGKYQQSPEYKRVHNDMGLEDFKFIYWMEYAHRMWGRGLGLFFGGPFAYFMYKGFITWRLGLRLSAFLAMGAGQGFVGWWMVKSGLEEPSSEYSQPRVSPYRLAVHLTSAFVIYSGVYWTFLSVLMPEPPTEKLGWVKGSARLRILAVPIAALVALTAASGAFVAGNDAGHAFNTFPKMGDYWIPEGLFEMQPVIRNIFENTATVQFNHRILATSTVVSMGILWLAARRLPLNPSVQALVDSSFGMAVLQATLGISTLLSYVPISLGVAHQAGALTLFTLIITLLHMLRRPSTTALKGVISSSKFRT
eukprot:c18470_g1_i1 orf=155-1531(+)